MHKHHQFTLDRFVSFASQIPPRLYSASAPLEMTVFDAPGRIGFAEAVQGEYKPLELGRMFDDNWGTHWVRVRATVPAEWAGREVHLRWNSSSEACLWSTEGQILQGITYDHRPEYRIARTATGGETLEFYIEVACNELLGVGIQLWEGNDEDRREWKLKQAELSLFETELFAFKCDFEVIAELAAVLPDNHYRAGQALATANAMLEACDLDDPSTWAPARELGRAFLAETNGDAQLNLSAIGHAHIDTAWLWPLAETKRKCYRTFASALRYMEDYPEYKFVCSQAQQWEWMRDEQPELFARIREKVEAGQFIPCGGSWIEPDCNIPSGESLVRQFLYGQRFFEKEFGYTSPIFWNPDVFGYCAQLPQILRGVEMKYFLTQKINWNQFNKFPHHTFQWEGIDGSRVLAHFPPGDDYNTKVTMREVMHSTKNYRDHGRSREAYMVFGWGDGGGGPTPEMLERLRRIRDLDGVPRIEMRSPEAFFARLEADAKDLCRWVGELYLEIHRGTYTSQSNNKKWNRESETLMRDVECLLAMTLDAEDYPRETIDHLWKLILLNQFHDIIPGSSIREVYEDSDRDYEEIRSTATALRSEVLEALAEAPGPRLLAFNPLGHARSEVIELPEGVAGSAQKSSDGTPLGLVAVPALGAFVVEPQEPAAPLTATEDGEGFTLENEQLRVRIDRNGRMSSLFDKTNARESIAEGQLGNNLVLFEDRPVRWEAWDVDVFHLDKRWDLPTPESIELVERGPLRAVIEVAYKVGKASTLYQRIILTACARRVDFLTTVDWHEARRFLKVEFPWELRAMNAKYEIQFGHLERPTHTNTSWDMARFEVAAQRWGDLSEPDYGVALLNDGRYGYGAQDHVMRLSLLRSPKMPDAEADMGMHTVTYAVYPHGAGPGAGGVIEQAACLNSPLSITPTCRAGEGESWFTIDNPAVVIDTVKRSEEGDAIILRLYEAHGTRCRARLASSLPVASVAACNLLERDDEALSWEEGGVTLDFEPFKIRTIKLTLN